MGASEARLSLEEGKQTIENLTARLPDEETSIAKKTELENYQQWQNKMLDNKRNIRCYLCSKQGHLTKK